MEMILALTSTLRSGRRPSPRQAVVALALATLVLASSVSAFWTSGGGGVATASVGTLAVPTAVTASSTPGTGVVDVSWSGPVAPDGGPVDGYYVVRSSGGTDTAACGSSPGSLLPAAPSACSDTGVTAGTYAYTVVAVFRTWTSTSAPSAPVVVVTDIIPPAVSSIDRADPSPTNAASVGWDVVFSEVVTGVDASDFTLSSTGLAGPSVTSVTGSGDTYTVSASTGSGDGTLGLELVDDDSIADATGNPLGGAGAGNGDFAGQVYTVDRSPPSAPVLVLSAATGNTYVTGTTAFVNAQAGRSGSFQVDATSADAESGIQQLSFPLLAGFSAGGGDDSSSPYQTTYSWSDAVSANGAQSVSATNNAGLQASSDFTVTPDVTPPSVTAPSVAGGYVTSLSIAVTRGSASDAGSGLDASSPILQRDQAALSGGSCDPFPGSWSAVTLSGGNDTSVASGTCYRYREVALDNVGNQSSSPASGTVEVDTSAPSAPVLVLSAATGNTYVTGTTAFVNAQAGRSGTFQVDATSADAESGIQKLSFPVLAGFSAGGGDDSSSPYQTTYSWSDAVSANGAQSVSATNNAGLQASSEFTVTPDVTAPTGGALTVNGVAASSGGSSSSNATGSFPIDLRTDWAETPSATEAGLLSSTLTREYGTTCSSFGAPTTITGSPAQSGLVDGCYRYALTGVDRVGNQVAVSTTVTVSIPLVITGAHDGGGASKVKISGSGGSFGGGSVTVVVCRSSSFPCSGPNTAATLTATVAADGTWLTNASGNIGAGPFWARATQGARTSAVFGSFAPPYPP